MREAAKKLKIAHPHLSNVENGKTGFSIELLAKMTEIYDADPYFIWRLSQLNSGISAQLNILEGVKSFILEEAINGLSAANKD